MFKFMHSGNCVNLHPRRLQETTTIDGLTSLLVFNSLFSHNILIFRFNAYLKQMRKILKRALWPRGRRGGNYKTLETLSLNHPITSYLGGFKQSQSCAIIKIGAHLCCFKLWTMLDQIVWNIKGLTPSCCEDIGFRK